MKIINLTQTQYRNYSNIHSKRNFGQTIEYSMLHINNNKKRLFLGLVDDMNNLHAATLILISNISPTIKEAISPNGFLIDYSNFELVETFTKELIKHLKKEKVTYLITNPMFKYRVYDKHNHIIENNQNILNNLLNLNYTSIGYLSDFERYDVVIEEKDSESNIYKHFNRNTRRNIKDALNMEIILRKGTNKDLEKSYNIFKKKTTNSIEYYKNLMNIYNNKDNKMEIFFTEINPNNYLINSKKLYEKEKIKNEKIHETFNKNIGNITEKLLNKKINSDSTLEKYLQNLNRAIILDQNNKENIIVGTSIIIRNNHEIYFLMDGYKEEYRSIYTSDVLKWAIIKKYFKDGYKTFNLGEIHKDYFNKESKYHGQYKYKIGFGGNVIEYTPNLLYVINKPLYNAYISLNKLKPKKKSK